MNISLPAFFDILIGLVFIYLIISLLASEIQELIAGFRKWRAKHLKKSIYLMLSGNKIKRIIDNSLGGLEKKLNKAYNKPKENPEDITSIKLVKDIYNHFEIATLEQSSLGFFSNSENQYGASYIPPESFAEAFTDVILEKIQENPNEVGETSTSDETDKTLTLDKLKKLEKLPDIPKHTGNNLSRIIKKIRLKLDSNPTEQQIRSEFIKEIAIWFQRAQDRTTGTYKRNSKIVMFCIGLAAAIIANANTFTIVENLYDEDVREAVVTQALSSVDVCKDKTEKELQSCLDTHVDKALDINKLPIGWSNINIKDNSIEELGEDALKNLVFVIQNIVGYLVTALAVMMGAPFWFDLLKKFINVRNAGVKPKSVEADSTKE